MKRILFFGSLAVVLLFLLSPVGSVLWGDRYLEVHLLRLETADGQSDKLVVPKNVSRNLSKDETSQLKRTGLKGRIERLGKYAANTYQLTWPEAKAIVVFTSTLTEDLSILQPKYTSIIYVQERNTFSQHPNEASTISRNILFGKSGSDVLIDTFNPGRSGFAANINRGFSNSEK